MKKSKIILFLLIILPVFINAAVNDYSTSLTNAQNFITKGNYKNTYQKYVKCGSYVGSCDKVGFVDKITYDSSKVNGYSYLGDGVEYFTGTTSGTQVYIINYAGETELKPRTSKYSSRGVVQVNPEVEIRGNGTYSNPWTFDPMYEVKVRTDTRYGTVEGSSSTFVSRGETVTFTLSAKTGYRYINNDCGGEYSNGVFTVKNIRRNTTCNVVFGTGKYKITLVGATPSEIYLRYGENFYQDSDYTRVITSVNTLPTKTGYTFEGYKIKIGETEYTLVGPDKKINRQLSDKIEEDRDIDPTYKINTPAVPTITGGATKVYGRSDTTLTCATTSTYASGTNIYYQFGYATSSGGNVSWQGSYSTTNTTTISKTAYRNTRYYKCRVKATADGSTSGEIVSTQEQQVTLLNARVDLIGNTGTISGTNPFYVSYGNTKKFTERYGSAEVTTQPSASKAGYTLNGWYTAETGGTKVMNANGTLVASVSNWTNASSQWILTKTSATVGTNQLYAQFDANPLTFANQTRTGTYSFSTQTFSVTAASNGTGSYAYTEKSEKNSAGTATSYFTLSGTTITAAANTPAGSYTYVITATDNGSGAAKDATYTITINKKAVTITASSQSRDYNGSALTNSGCSANSGGLFSGHTVTCAMTAASTITNVGSVANTINTVTIKNSSGTNITANYNVTKANGTLTVNKKAVTVTAASQSREYNGSALTNSGCTGSGLVSGHTVTCTMTSGSIITNAGSVSNTINTVTIKSGSTDVSSNYNVTKATGTLTVTKIATTLSCSNLTYTGSEQTACTCTGGTVSGEYKATAAGEHTASCTVDANHEAPSNKKWTMNKKALTITANNQTINYGTSISTGTSYVTSSGLVSGHSLSDISLTASTTNITSSGTITPSGATIKNGSGTVVTDNYNITYSKGTLVIKKGTCPKPTDLKITSSGVVTWSSVTGASSYQISKNGTSFSAATSGINYKSNIGATGTTTIYVRSVCDTTYYNEYSESATLGAKYCYRRSEPTTAKTVDGIDYMCKMGNSGRCPSKLENPQDVANSLAAHCRVEGKYGIEVINGVNYYYCSDYWERCFMFSGYSVPKPCIVDHGASYITSGECRPYYCENSGSNC